MTYHSVIYINNADRATQENDARVIDLKRSGDRYAFVMIDNTQ